MDETADILLGAGEGVMLLPAARYGFFLILKAQAGFALACGFVKGALLCQDFLLRNSRPRFVQAVGGSFRFADRLLKLRRRPVFLGELQA